MSSNLSPQQAVYQTRIDDYENRARKTGNLVYVWMAINQAHVAGFPMPEWCYGQITYWAMRLYELAHLLDPDKDFGRLENEADEALGERVHARWAKPELSPKEALEKAKATFGFGGQGWNAFNHVRIDEEAITEQIIQDGKKHEPPGFAANLPNPIGESQARQKRRRRNAAKSLAGTPKQVKT